MNKFVGITGLVGPQYAEDYGFDGLQTSDVPPVRCLLEGDSVRARPLDGVLADEMEGLESARDPAAVRDAAERLLMLVHLRHWHHALRAWVEVSAPRWIDQRHPAMAAVLDVGAHYGIEGWDRWLVMALQRDEGLTARVAAQRLRHVPIREALRTQAWAALSVYLSGRLDAGDMDAAGTAALSAAYVGRDQSVVPLVELVREGTPAVATRAAWGLAELADLVREPGQTLSDEQRMSIVDACLCRWEREHGHVRAYVPGEDVAAATLPAAGVFALAANVGRVVDALLRAFTDGAGDEAPASVRGTRSVLRGTAGGAAQREFESRRLDASASLRLLSLAARGG